MILPSTIVVLDDHKQWVDIHTRLIRELPVSDKIDVAGFTNDRQAEDFVKRNPGKIQGYIQDLRRNQTNTHDQDSLDGIRFINRIVIPYTPTAWVLIVSGSCDPVEVLKLEALGSNIYRFFDKFSFDPVAFKDAVQSTINTRLRLYTDDLTVARKSMIEVVNFPYEEYCRYLVSDPEQLHKMEPKRFEELIAEMYRSYGWQVDLTSTTRDGGYDIIAVRKSFPTDVRVLIEAKRFAPDRSVGVQIVRSLYGIRVKNSASQVVLATSSYVSSDAKKEFCRVVPWELDFIEREKILSWCRTHGGVLLGGSLEKK